MLIGSWNVRTLYRTGSIIMLTQQLIQYNLDIAAIQETRWQDKHIMDTKTYTFFLGGKYGRKHEYGVAFAVKEKVRNKVLDFKAIDQRICLLRIKTKFGNLSLMNACAPTEESDDVDKDRFYQTVERAYDPI
jgi:exonuclease III